MRRALLLCLALCPLAPAAERPRLFRAPTRPAVPAVKDRVAANNPIDLFVLARLEAKKLTFTSEADRTRLLRRVTFDLTGLLPTVAEGRAFLADKRPGAYERLVDRLLASPRFGERQAQFWLDLVRYAETDGFKEDALRPSAHRYRDWVIKARNDNMPYDRFVRLQLAGDELEPNNPDALVATGFNRLWPDEYNAANLEQRRQEILDDTTDTTAQVFLALTAGCARCHDHKYDPITQKDYFRLQAFFAAMQPRELIAGSTKEIKDYQTRLAAWEKKTAKTRQEMDKLVGAKGRSQRATTLLRFNPDIQKAVNTSPELRTPYQWIIALMAIKQLDRAERDAFARLPAAQKKRYQELQKTLPPRPTPPLVMAVTDIGSQAPPTYRLIGGNWHRPAKELTPGFPEVLSKAKPDTSLPRGAKTTGRRAALARWLTANENPLTARVMVNRLWQQHFGQGIVATASDFGAQGTPPTHPELLDWLAVELVESGWDLKHLHRLMVTSAAYRQDSLVDPDNATQRRAGKIDPQNNLLWHARRRRLEGEAIRDNMLALSEELTSRMFGPSAKPKLPANLSKYAWKPDEKSQDRNRRSIYVLAKRNLRYPLFDAFDLPDQHNSCARRLVTTTAPQALVLFNSEFSRNRASAWAGLLSRAHGSDQRTAIVRAYRSAWSRGPDEDEIELGMAFLKRQTALYRGEKKTDAEQQALVDLCHAVLNTSEFVYVD